jgi:hypothetical protein
MVVVGGCAVGGVCLYVQLRLSDFTLEREIRLHVSQPSSATNDEVKRPEKRGRCSKIRARMPHQKVDKPNPPKESTILAATILSLPHLPPRLLDALKLCGDRRHQARNHVAPRRHPVRTFFFPALPHTHG